MDTIILRRWPDEELIALFPDIKYNMRGLVHSYMHLGQHGGADYALVVRQTRPVSYSNHDSERDEFIQELKRKGYTPQFRTRRTTRR